MDEKVSLSKIQTYTVIDVFPPASPQGVITMCHLKKLTTAGTYATNDACRHTCSPLCFRDFQYKPSITWGWSN